MQLIAYAPPSIIQAWQINKVYFGPVDLRSFDVVAAGVQPAELLRIETDPREALAAGQSWTWTLLPGYVAALAIEGKACQVNCRQWQGNQGQTPNNCCSSLDRSRLHAERVVRRLAQASTVLSGIDLSGPILPFKLSGSPIRMAGEEAVEVSNLVGNKETKTEAEQAGGGHEPAI
jgi:hypothetical protein